MNHQPHYRFTNWAKNETSVARNYYQPETEEQLIELLEASSKIRLVGTGHSWSAICLSNDTLINTDRYNRVLHIDTEKMQVKVQAGIKLWQLNEYLDKQGLALKNLGSISRQSVAGAISTGTHGSGIGYQILGSQVEEMSLLKADGKKVTLQRKGDKELFNQCLVNLGSLGIVSDLTINIVPAFRLHEQTYVMNYNEAVAQLDELVNSTDHFKMWWFPHTEQVVVYRYMRTKEPPNDSRFRQWFMDELVSVNLYRLLLKIGTVNRNWRININRSLLKNFLKPLDRIEKSYKVFNVPEPPLHREAEWAFDISVAKELLIEYKRLINASKHRFNFIQEIRFTKADEFALSGCYGRNTVWLGAYNADNYGWTELLSDFENFAMMYNGRPHWGKEFTVTTDYLRSVYPKFMDFAALRKQFDPNGKFENDFISQIFS